MARILVEIFTAPGCGRCGQAIERLEQVVDELGLRDQVRWRRVNVLSVIDRAVDLGVLATPALVVDGRKCYTGVPSRNWLRQWLSDQAGEQAGEGI